MQIWLLARSLKLRFNRWVYSHRSITMKNLQLITACSLSMLLISNTQAKIQTYTYDDGACEYKNQYDDQKISIKQIKDSIQLSDLASSSKLNTDTFAFSPEKIPAANIVDQLKKEYTTTKQQIQQLSPAPQPKYQQLKQIVLRQLDDEYKMSGLIAQSYRNPKILLTQDYGKKCYAIAEKMSLKGQAIKTASLAQFKVYMNEQIKLGQSTEFAQQSLQNFQAKLSQSQGESYAFLNLLKEWNNCAIDALPDDESKIEQINIQRDLFVKSKELYCEN